MINERYRLDTPVFGEKYEAKKEIEATSKHWRDYLIAGVRSKNPRVYEKTSDFMIENLLRYSQEGRQLSREGYKEIQKNWLYIMAGTEKYDIKEIRMARNYLISEHNRLEEEALKKARANILNSEENSWTDPYKSPEKGEKKGFFGRATSLLGRVAALF